MIREILEAQGLISFLGYLASKCYAEMPQKPALESQSDCFLKRPVSIISDTNLDIQWLLLPQNPSFLILPFPGLVLSLKVEIPKEMC